MKTLHRTRLAIAVLALGGLGAAPAAHADPATARVVGGILGALVTNSVMKIGAKKAHCRLYDRDGMEVYLPCDPKAPIGEVMVEGQAETYAQAPSSAEPLPAASPHDFAHLDHGPDLDAPSGDCLARGDGKRGRRHCEVRAEAPAYAHPPVVYAPPVQADCGCGTDSHAQGRNGAGRVAGSYESYSQTSRGSRAVSYEETYSGGGYGYGYNDGFGYAFTGGVGSTSSFYPYGGVGYENGGYAAYDYGYARVAGRDRSGFLTWAGKPVR